MGSWGHKAFESDSAMDWWGDVEDDGVSAVKRALKTAAETDADDYLDADDGHPAIAAAELVAAALREKWTRLPATQRVWAKKHAPALAKLGAPLARKAIARVTAESSELPALFEGDEAWLAEVAALEALLGQGKKK